MQRNEPPLVFRPGYSQLRSSFPDHYPENSNAECGISSEVIMGRALCAFSKLITKCRTMLLCLSRGYLRLFRSGVCPLQTVD